MHITDHASDDLDQLDNTIREYILKKLYWFVAQTNPLWFAKRLRGGLFGHYRFRIGDYRAIFDVDNHGAITILVILRIRHRREVYE